MDAKKADDSNSQPQAAGWEILKAHEIRDMLFRLGGYPTGDMNNDPMNDYHEKYIREHLPAMLDGLQDRNDLVCIYRLVELFVKAPPAYFINQSIEELNAIIDKRNGRAL